MFERTLEATEAPHIIVRKCLGNLMVKGGEEQITVRVHDGDEELHVEQEGDTIRLSVAADCTLLCPLGTALTAERVQGNLQCRDVQGAVDLKLIHGNATLRQVGPVTLGKVLGNIRVHGLTGSLQAVDVKGNVRVQGVEGPVELSQVAGNLTAEGLPGGLAAEKVRGNVRLGPPFQPEMIYRLNAGGNLTVKVPVDASLRLAVTTRGHVDFDISGLELKREKGEVRGTLGDGAARVEGDVKGNLSLRQAGRPDTLERSAGLEDLGAHIEWQVNEALAQMASRMEASLGRVDAEAVKRRVERTTEEARRKAERAAEQARLRAERAERRWERASGRKARPKEAASDEERLRVLRMVEQGKLTPQEASEILAALEG